MIETKHAEDVSLLFDNETRVLGELATNGGTLARILLTAEGERAIGDAVAAWQTEGVPYHRKLVGVQYHDKVSVRDKAFLDAVRQWAAVMRLHLVVVGPEVFVCWQLMSRLPLENVQRYSMLVALTGLGPTELAEWRQALTEADAGVQAERDRTSARIKDMWGRTALEAVKRSARSKAQR